MGRSALAASPSRRTRRLVLFGGLLVLLLVSAGLVLAAHQWGGPAASAGPARPADAQPMLVDHVYDGDTVWLQATAPGRYVAVTERVKVRLIGVDTPELKPTAECFAQQATDEVRRLLPAGSTVYVTADRSVVDRYDRRLLYIWLDSGDFLNFEIVAQGWGTALAVRPDLTYADVFADAEVRARAEHLGQWAVC